MKILYFLIFITMVFASNDVYKGWKSYYVRPSSSKEVRDVLLMNKLYAVDFLMMPTVKNSGIALVRPKHLDNFTKYLDDLKINYEIHSDNIKAALDSDFKKIARKEKTNLATHTGMHLPYDNYQELEVINKYVINIANKYPCKVTLVQPSLSFESRPLYYLKISTSNFDGSKPVIIIDGGMHAREWISPPTVTWAIHKLVENVTEPDLLENFDWIIFPVVNPDGYKYTFTHERFWRKNRSKNTHCMREECRGVDINRNFDFMWMSVGSSENPCIDIYAGDRPFSEVETRTLGDIFLLHRNNTALYMSMHSFGSYILYPWGHNSSESNNLAALNAVSTSIADAINSVTSFEKYTVGNSAIELLYESSGASDDYAHSIGIPLTFTFELPGFSLRRTGFNMDPSFIELIVKETWNGIVAGVRQAYTFKQSRFIKKN